MHPARRQASETLSPVTSHSAALLNLQMPFRLCCSARQRLQHNRLHVRRRGRTQRCEVPQHDCAPKRHFSRRSRSPSAAARQAARRPAPPRERDAARGSHTRPHERRETRRTQHDQRRRVVISRRPTTNVIAQRPARGAESRHSRPRRLRVVCNGSMLVRAADRHTRYSMLVTLSDQHTAVPAYRSEFLTSMR